MRYTPKHIAATPSPARRRIAGIAIAASAATLGAGVVNTTSAEAATGIWDRLASCESGGNWHINTGNGFYGGVQFTQQTWVGYGGRQFASYAHYASREAQIVVAKRVLADVGPRAWPVCSVRVGLTRSNGLADGSGSNDPVSRGSSRDLAVDGAFGPMTIRATQKWIGTTQDGVWGPASKRALQRKVGVSADGIIGRQTIAALQSRIGVSRDGASYLNARTVMGLQRYLNAHVL